MNCFLSSIINIKLYIWKKKLKEQFTQKWKWTHSQVIHDADEFVSLSEQIWRNLALHLLLSNGSSAVNGCRQNESPNLSILSI